MSTDPMSAFTLSQTAENPIRVKGRAHHSRGRSKPTKVITLTSDGIFPSKTDITPGRRIAFATAGKNAPTSVTVTSNDPKVPDTALFGGGSNTYAVPSKHTVQSREYSKDIHRFTITTNLGQTATINQLAQGLGTPMNSPTKPTP
ncbi:MAG TPA: hypothetical protein PK156_41110 [Polyangium sp.]|nr:hypothetical protein [Polyangium sp.]